MIWVSVLIFVAFLTACGQILFKFAAMEDAPFVKKFVDVRFILGVVLFLVCPVLTIFALKHIEYSRYYATTALNYVFVICGSRFALKERVDLKKLIGIILILIGLFFYML
jgi:drug/metabolite transporter (DMT)-like permease